MSPEFSQLMQVGLCAMSETPFIRLSADILDRAHHYRYGSQAARTSRS